jgi:sialate O-acetylesterase
MRCLALHSSRFAAARLTGGATPARWLRLLCLIGCFFGYAAFAEVKPNPMFSDNAVLQQGAEVPVWGMARDGESVTVEFQGQRASATARDGQWKVRLKTLKPGGPFTMTIQGDNRVVLTNLLVGEVWLCGGQSNMEWALSRSDGGVEAIAGSANPRLRMCRVPHNVQMTPQREVKVKWEESQPATAKNFSAVPYWFGRKLQKELGVPVGIINSAFGGTPIQSWMPAETLKQGPWPQDRWSDLAQAKADYGRKAEAARPLKDKYEADKAAALAQKLPAPSQPPGIPSEFKGATTLWNGEVAPLLPYRIRGVAWYQGENNAYVGVADTYKDLLPAMIRDWRKGFEQPDLPFLIFQIARNRKWQTDPNEKSGIAELQEAQMKTALATPHTALIVTTDMGETNVHYTGKEPIGERATMAALVLAYGRKMECSGPIYQEAQFQKGKAVVRFNHTTGGLVVKDGPLAGFVIAGKDGKFVFADAAIEGYTVVVSSPQVPEPAAVRYGWADMPKVNLFNGAGLPASPFRTDNWPL